MVFAAVAGGLVALVAVVGGQGGASRDTEGRHSAVGQGAALLQGEAGEGVVEVDRLLRFIARGPG